MLEALTTVRVVPGTVDRSTGESPVGSAKTVVMPVPKLDPVRVMVTGFPCCTAHDAVQPLVQLVAIEVREGAPGVTEKAMPFEGAVPGLTATRVWAPTSTPARDRENVAEVAGAAPTSVTGMSVASPERRSTIPGKKLAPVTVGVGVAGSEAPCTPPAGVTLAS